MYIHIKKELNLKPPITIEQGKNGYRYTIEPFFLADFSNPQPGHAILDIGTGCGVMPILLASRDASLKITAIEIQQSLYEISLRNVRNNGLENRVTVLHGDFLKESAGWKPKLFDKIISNPPYGKSGCVRLNPDREKAIARHELTLTMASLIQSSVALLKPEGALSLSYPPYRYEEALNELRSNGLNPSRVVFVHGRPRTHPQFFMIEAVKSPVGNCARMDPCYIFNEDGSPTREVNKIYASFNCHCRSHGRR